MLENGENPPMPKGLNFYLSQTDEISNDEILAHVTIGTPELAIA